MPDSLEVSVLQRVVCPEFLIPCIFLATFPLLEYLDLFELGALLQQDEYPWARGYDKGAAVQLTERWIPKWQLEIDAFLPPQNPSFDAHMCPPFGTFSYQSNYNQVTSISLS